MPGVLPRVVALAEILIDLSPAAAHPSLVDVVNVSEIFTLYSPVAVVVKISEAAVASLSTGRYQV